jgi:hypothetical protein
MTDFQQKAHDFLLKNGFLPHDNDSYVLLQKYRHSSIFQEKCLSIYVTWRNGYFGLYKIINDCLCSAFFHEPQEVYWTIQRPRENPEFPLQPVVDILCELCKNARLPSLKVKHIEAHLLDEYMAVQNHTIKKEYSVDFSEYAYKTAELLNLKGNANYYKRKRVKKFLNINEISVRPITKSNVHLCNDIEEEWCRSKDCSFCRSFFDCEKKAVRIMTEIFNEEIHKGLFLYYNDKPAGFIICEPISEHLSFLLFGKSTLEDGFVYLVYIMYRDFLKNTEYMNFNEDMGNLGLRKFKKLLSVYELWHKYFVTYDL